MRAYQSFRGAEQRLHCSAQSIPFDYSFNNSPGTREYELFKKIASSAEKESDGHPWGLLSWSFDLKSPASLDEFIEFAGHQFSLGYDVVFLNPKLLNEAMFTDVWEQGRWAHSELRPVFDFLEASNKRSFGALDTKGFLFCNYFFATPRAWDKYFRYVDEILSIIEVGGKLGKLLAQESGYPSDPSTQLRVFLIERLFSAFINSQNELNVTSWRPNLSHFVDRFGVYLGQKIWDLHVKKAESISDLSNIKLMKSWDISRREIFGNQAARRAAFYLENIY